MTVMSATRFCTTKSVRSAYCSVRRSRKARLAHKKRLYPWKQSTIPVNRFSQSQLDQIQRKVELECERFLQIVSATAKSQPRRTICEADVDAAIQIYNNLKHAPLE